MAMKKQYYTVNGRIIGEKTAGGSRVDYLTDALGNVTATVDQNAAVVKTYRYKPYGGLLAKTGVGPDPKFRWVGAHGYRQTGKEFSDAYVRARHYSSRVATWTTPDTLSSEPWHAPYRYVKQNPTSYVDPSGLQEKPPPRKWPGFKDNCKDSLPDPVRRQIEACMTKLCAAIGDPAKAAAIRACFGDLGGEYTIDCLDNWCKTGPAIFCENEFCTPYVTTICKCDPEGTTTKEVLVPPFAFNNCIRDNDPRARITICTWWFSVFPTLCPYDDPLERPGRTADVPGSWGIVMLHELVHLCGKCKGGGPAHVGPYSVVVRCVARVLGCPPYERR
ncbi:MAG: hypothetical protein IH851_03425 [Armatimonadetes bacterium]|nr:hypothetical protein [Armatimonadota bacterium]